MGRSAPPKASSLQRKHGKNDAMRPVVSQPKDPPPSKSRLLLAPIPQWYASTPSLPPVPTLATPDSVKLQSLVDRAARLYEAELSAYRSPENRSTLAPSSGDASFLEKILHSGTLSDKLSALTLLVQSSPIHNTKALETLKGMAERGRGQGGREESLKALRCIVDWWVGGGGPGRKLKPFRDQPLLHPSVTDIHLIVWHFEDWLKKYFFSVLQIMETLSLDPLTYVRTQTLAQIFNLLSTQPEQEQNLLRLLVNKLGDTDRTICSRASYHLLRLLQAHPSMKHIVIREMVALVFRQPASSAAASHIRFDATPAPKDKEKKEGNPHARYYSAITFNQIVLTPGDRAAAVQLIDVYFNMFKDILGDAPKDAQPAAPKDTEEPEERDRRARKGRDVKGKGKGKGKAGDDGAFTEVEDASSRLVSAILTGINRALPFAKISKDDPTFNRHLDTLFLITHTSTFNISLQALVLIHQISATLLQASPAAAHPVVDRYYRTLYGSLHDARLATSAKQAMYLNLLFKALKVDPNAERAKAFVRRFVQVVAGTGATEFVAGGLYLLGELFSTIPGLRSMVTKPASGEDVGEGAYDPRKRDPQYAHADASPLWELVPLMQHYHPTIALHARQLLSAQPLTASADLSLNTLGHFLDRFVFKNPKKGGEGRRGGSAMQPAAHAQEQGAGVRLVKGEARDREGMMNEAAFVRRKREDVPVDQAFFHAFFTSKKAREAARTAKAKKRKGNGDEDDEDEDDDDDEEEEGAEEEVGSDEDVEEAVDSDAEEAEVWKAMKATLPKEDGDDDLLLAPSDEEDEIPSDLDDDDDDDDDLPSGLDDGSEKADGSDGESLAEASDAEDLIGLDELIEYDGSDASGAESGGEEWGGIGGKRKREAEVSSKEKKRKLRSLPTFATYEDYARMIEDGPEDNI